MKVDMVMPQMGESLAEGTIVKWLKSVGDPVERDEIILEISTDKVDSEIPAPESGTLVEILADAGDTIEVGKVIARIDKEGGAAASSESKSAEKEPPKQETEAKTESPRDDRTERKAFLSPVVKKIAQEHDISLSVVENLEGSGANGRITKQDILDYIEHEQPEHDEEPKEQLEGAEEKAEKAEPKAAPKAKPEPEPEPEGTGNVPAPTADYEGEVDVVEMDHMRKRIADHMVMSKRTAAHVTSVAECDLSRIVAYREKYKDRFNEQEGVKLTYTAFFVMAVAKALKEFPLINSSVQDDKILQKKKINIGIAVGMEKGLIVPVIKSADQLNLIGAQKRLSELAANARNKKLLPQDVQGGTFSITNIGTFGNLWGTPIINQPQVAILGTGAIKKRPVVVDDMIAIRSMMYLSLTYDHRIIDGLYAGSFLQRVVQLLENYEPESL
ncbi:2-oxo acid dehydrogenase subunit E2 [candidate division KSB1 bacterium]|nr:2-oxo acid dehydrogenase subunit E2 [candidate division KSB1 bacterium]